MSPEEIVCLFVESMNVKLCLSQSYPFCLLIYYLFYIFLSRSGSWILILFGSGSTTLLLTVLRRRSRLNGPAPALPIVHALYFSGLLEYSSLRSSLTAQRRWWTPWWLSQKTAASPLLVGIIGERYRRKKRHKSSLLFGGKNLFNS